MKLSPQQRRLLDALRAAGPRGIHTLDARAELKVGNPSQRREELQGLGWEIGSRVERRGRSHGARYWLISEPAGVGVAAVREDSRGTDPSGVDPLPPPAPGRRPRASTLPDDARGPATYELVCDATRPQGQRFYRRPRTLTDREIQALPLVDDALAQGDLLEEAA